jgi:hypothetical protein
MDPCKLGELWLVDRYLLQRHSDWPYEVPVLEKLPEWELRN